MSGHTPGPYAYWLDPEQNKFLIFQDLQGRAYGRLLATIEGVKGQTEANARLVAAAPDLLDALVGLMSSYENYASMDKPESEWDEYDHMMFPIWKAARNAIAKAHNGEVTP